MKQNFLVLYSRSVSLVRSSAKVSMMMPKTTFSSTTMITQK